MRWTRATPIDEGVGSRTAKACGPDASTLASGDNAPHYACGDNKARSPGRARHRPLKPFACGNAGCSGGLVVANSCAFYFLHARLRVRCRIRHSPRPLWADDFRIARAYRAARTLRCIRRVPGRKKRNHLLSRRLVPRCKENYDGTQSTQIFEEGIRQRRARDEEAQRRHVEERPVRSNGQEPQAGNRDRSLRGAGRRTQGAEEGNRPAAGQESQTEGQRLSRRAAFHLMGGSITMLPPLVR